MPKGFTEFILEAMKMKIPGIFEYMEERLNKSKAYFKLPDSNQYPIKKNVKDFFKFYIEEKRKEEQYGAVIMPFDITNEDFTKKMFEEEGLKKEMVFW